MFLLVLLRRLRHMLLEFPAFYFLSTHMYLESCSAIGLTSTPPFCGISSLLQLLPHRSCTAAVARAVALCLPAIAETSTPFGRLSHHDSMIRGKIMNRRFCPVAKALS